MLRSSVSLGGLAVMKLMMLKSNTMNGTMWNSKTTGHIVVSCLSFYCNQLHFASIGRFTKLFFVQSHGQAWLECGFSVNLKVLDENMQELSLVSRWMLYDHISSNNVKIHGFNAPKSLMKKILLAHQWSVQHLEKLKASKESNEADGKKKTIQ